MGQSGTEIHQLLVALFYRYLQAVAESTLPVPEGRERDMRGRITAAAILFLCMVGLLAGMITRTVYAQESSANNALSGEVFLLRQDGDNYVMQVTVKNAGADFYGTVQVIFQGTYKVGNCAYNTEITLPAQGEKQYTLTIPERAVDATAGACILNFLDGKGNTVQSIAVKNLLLGFATGVSVGILSDDYAGLTYLDAGGTGIYFQGDSTPLNLIRLDRDSLSGYLDGLYFLVIDQFNVSALAQEDIEALEQWVRDGGWLIIGTGAYAEQTLSGFDPAFLDLAALEISQPGEDNILLENSRQYGYYYSYTDSEVDFSQMTVARLGDALSKNSYRESSENPAVYTAVGKGAVAVYCCSLGDTQMGKLTDNTVLYMFEELMYQAQNYGSYNIYSDMDAVGQRALAYMANRDSGVDFSLLRLLIGVYVVLAGPILYLVLRKCKKSEWYWVGVPALGMLFIAGVFVLGMNARVSETRVYSVTAQKADEDWKDTYFLAYHSGVKPWSLPLAEEYEIAGPGWNGYDGKYMNNTGEYFYTVDYDSEGMHVGAKPRENFENGFFYARGRAESRGTLTGSHIKEFADAGGSIIGSVTNGTDCDLTYMAVWRGTDLMIFKDVKAGETLDLPQAERDGRCIYQSRNMEDVGDLLLYGGIGMSYYGNAQFEEEDMEAFLIGLGMARQAAPEMGQAVIAGLIGERGRVSAGKCKETSYQCLYGYAETEV